MDSNLIVMLTHQDQTVSDAIEVFNECKHLPVKYWGFKNVGLEKAQMETLVYNMKEAGKITFLEVVTYSEEECMQGARIAVELKFDYLLGTLYYPSVYDFLKGYEIKYMPFCGKVSGSPSILKGTNQEIIEDAKNIFKNGVFGFDLLAYRHTKDGESLAREFCKAIDCPVVIAGSINSFKRIKFISDINPWGFTIGSAFFDKKFDNKASIVRNIELVIEYMNTL
ncbi:hypothetical protein DXT63_06805 [Thermoanaerobacteraceae bacterium SP2]|nr:hypothetical protein DXT63_06805 [Thermoanaerobacteraceae bacterium SP2]